MKNFLFVLIFLFTVGSFAQGTSINLDATPCVSISNFVPDCHVQSGAGTYTIQVCSEAIQGMSEAIQGMSEAQIRRMIQEYVCIFNAFPDFVTIVSYTPRA